MSSSRQRLCAVGELPEGESRGFDLDGDGQDELFVVNRAGTLYGYRNSCPHQPGAPMAWRRHAYLNKESSLIVCFAHGAQFDIESGLCIDGPCQGDSLTAVPLSQDPDGNVYLTE
ncbi:Rieske (2Fe-2S) protein [Marinobacterium sp. YM272]|uniref:Rieske (2Fe-2S) protein n=1 Tax=Marinobacterium sp. YM272 TaxID=3421654 RepID=UPI003D7FDB26